MNDRQFVEGLGWSAALAFLGLQLIKLGNRLRRGA